MSDKIIDIYRRAYETANTIFLNPKVQYSYDEIISGVKVKGKTMQAVDQSTFQAFGRFTENMFKVTDIYINYFLSNKISIINSLNSAKSENDLNRIEGKIYAEIYSELLKNTDVNRLNSYNRIRKPINLYIEHIVSMTMEITNRETLTPLLYLPLDKFIFGSEYTLSDYERKNLKVDPNKGFGQVKEENHYYVLQSYFKRKSEAFSVKLGVKFNRIYFDMFWKDRYLTHAGNLFLSNLPVSMDITNQHDAPKKLNNPKENEIANVVATANINNCSWDKLNSYKANTQVLVRNLAEALEHKGVKLSPKFRGDKAIVFTFKNNSDKNILTIWERSGGILVKILQWRDELCHSVDDFNTKGIIEAARKKYDEIS